VAMITGAVLPIAWALIYSGVWSVENPLRWHAHEMLYGFGWAALGGFLLTSSKNWVKIRGVHGAGLIFLFTLWVLERIVFHLPPSSSGIQNIFLNTSVIATAGYIFRTLLINRKADFYRDNFFFMIALVFFVPAKILILSEEFYGHGIAMTIGLFRFSFVMMLERTITQFMKTTMGVELRRSTFLDLSIKLAVLIAVFQSFLPTPIGAIVLAVSALLLLVRWIWWKPQLGLQQFGNAVMYIGYLGLVIHLMLEAFRTLGIFQGAGMLSTHVFTFLCMGLIIPSMFVRICQGHTGRKPQFLTQDKWAISIMGAGAFFRLITTQIWPEHYALWVTFAALAWLICFSVMGFRLIPYLFTSRIDGKEH